MKPSTLAVVAAVLLFSGCDRIRGKDKQSFTPNADVTGTWLGAATVSNVSEPVALELTNPTGWPIGQIAIGSILTGGVVGQVRGQTYQATLDEGSACPNKWTLTATVQGSAMHVTVTGAGNPAPCYTQAATITADLAR